MQNIWVGGTPIAALRQTAAHSCVGRYAETERKPPDHGGQGALVAIDQASDGLRVQGARSRCVSNRPPPAGVGLLPDRDLLA